MWVAHDVRPGTTPVAAKVLDLSRAGDEAALRGWWDEAELMRAIPPHRCIVHCLGVSYDPGTCRLCLFMELAEG